ncbi:MAG: histidine kinase N-terminal 7TM domain-containing protein [Fimbriimonadaceae bacterium]
MVEATWQINGNVAASWLSMTICLIVGFVAARSEHNLGTRAALPLFACLTWWTFWYGLELGALELPLAISFANVKYVGVFLLAPASLSFSLSITNQRHHIPRLGWWLLSIPYLILFTATWLEFFGLLQGALRPNPMLEKVPQGFVLAFTPGPFLNAFYLYSYGLFLASAVVIAKAAFQRNSLYSNQFRIVFACLIVPWIGNALYLFKIVPWLRVDPTPLLFSVTSALVLYGLLRYRLLDIVPVARDLVLERIPDAIAVFDAQDNLVDLNAQCARILGVDSQNVIGRATYTLFPEELWQRLKESGGPSDAIFPRMLGRIFSCTLTPIERQKGRLLGRIMAIQDVTLSRTLEEQLKIARDAAEESSRQKTLFLANMSHEIRTPLNGIVGTADVLLHEELPEDQRELVEIMAQSGRALARVLGDILDYSRIDAGKLTLLSEPFVLSAVVERAAQLFAPDAQAKGLSFQVKTEPSTRVTVLGDSLRLAQVVSNVVNNAVKFTSQGEVTVSLHLISSDETHVTIEVVVNDTGIGIEPERQQAIFESFTQEDPSISRRFGGTGLGLAISRSLARQMGGDITVKSQAGVGSSFSITIPFPLPTEAAE